MGLYRKLLVWWRKRKYVVVCFDDRCPHYCKDCNEYAPPKSGLCGGQYPPSPMMNPDVPVSPGSNAELAMMLETQGKVLREFLADLEQAEVE